MPESIGYTSKFLYLYTIPIWCILRALIIVVKFFKYKKLNFQREVLVFLFGIYIIMLIGLTLFPLEFYINGTSKVNITNINFIPFKDIGFALKNASLIVIVQNIGGNMFLLSPLILFIKLLYNKAINSYKTSFLLGLFISLSIEFLQFISESFLVPVNRSVDITDVVLNSIGCVIAFFIYKNLLAEKIPIKNLSVKYK